MVKRLSVEQAQATFGELVGEVNETKEPVLVEQRGQVVAAVVSSEQYAVPQEQREEVDTVKQTISQDQLRLRPLTSNQVKQGLAALERAAQLRARQLAERGGRPFPPSVDLIREVRRELDNRL